MKVIEIKQNKLKNFLIKIDYIEKIHNNFKKKFYWKNSINNINWFYFFKDNGEERIMHSESDKTEIKINEKPDEIIKQLFESLLVTF